MLSGSCNPAITQPDMAHTGAAVRLAELVQPIPPLLQVGVGRTANANDRNRPAPQPAPSADAARTQDCRPHFSSGPPAAHRLRQNRYARFEARRYPHQARGRGLLLTKRLADLVRTHGENGGTTIPVNQGFPRPSTDRCWLGCHSCGTSLLYHGGDFPGARSPKIESGDAPSPQSGERTLTADTHGHAKRKLRQNTRNRTRSRSGEHRKLSLLPRRGIGHYAVDHLPLPLPNHGLGISEWQRREQRTQ
jgi:hypothetical protein